MPESDDQNGPIGMYLFFYNCVLFILTNFFTLFRLYIPHNSIGRLGYGATTKTGPNDASVIVWAIGMYLFFYNRVLYTL